MKVIQINCVCGIRSTGRICTDLADILIYNQDECIVAFGREEVPSKWAKISYKICGKLDIYINALKARIFDSAGFGSVRATKKLINFIIDENPDVIHLHNIHGYYVDIKTLFNYLRVCGKPIVWSLYDCWSFTGHCAHFDYNKCFSWMDGCEKCRFKKEYPKSNFLSFSKRNYIRKKTLFTNIPNVHLIAPSEWMQSVVKKSFMKDYPIHVFPNGIDLTMFKPIKKDFRKKHGLGNKFVVLGVASFWNDLKGIKCFTYLAKKLPAESFQIVLVGNLEGNLTKDLDNVLWISNTNNVEELCEIYSAADVFLNPTLQETQGLTTIEAFACGTPAIVFDSGGAAECVDSSCGVVVEKLDFEGVYETILNIAGKKITFDEKSCFDKAKQYDKHLRYTPFIKLYEELIERI